MTCIPKRQRIAILHRSYICLLSLCLSCDIGFAQNFWQQTNGPNREGPVSSLAVSTNEVVFAGTAVGVFRTTDNGASWSNASPTWLTSYQMSIRALATKSNGFVIAGSAGGMIISTDDGVNWSGAVTPGINDIYTLSISSNGVIFVGDRNFVYRSTDNGANWLNVSAPTNSIIFLITFNSSGHIFAGTGGSGVFRSTNGGASWSQVNTGLTNSYVLSMIVNSNGNVFAGTNGGGVFRSTDNGSSWVNTGLTNVSINALVYNSNGDIFAGTTSGVYRSTNEGADWVEVNAGLVDNLNIASLAIDRMGYIYAGNYASEVFRSTQTTLESPPAITSFSPTSGPVGTTVTITGTNFSATAANNIVYFGAVRAMVTAATSTSLSVTVPAGATYAPITVTINGLTAYSQAPFIVTFSGGGSITASSFAAKVDFATGTSLSSVAIGDVDGDGKPDLAIGNNNSKTIKLQMR